MYNMIFPGLQKYVLRQAVIPVFFARLVSIRQKATYYDNKKAGEK